MRRMLVKKLLATLCAAAISISCVVNSVGAVDTTDAEIEYSLMFLDKVLPKDGNMDECKDLSQYNNLNSNRSETVKHENGTEEKKDIDEVKVYDEIKDTVQKLIDKVDERTPSHTKYKGKPSGNLDKSRKWRIAKAIYRWVAENVRYDGESKKKDKDGNSLRKPQDALFAFATKKCVCQGFADLIKVMMRLAGIPCVAAETVRQSDGSGHIYNAVYLDDSNDANRRDWVLLDASNVMSEGAVYQRTDEQKKSMKECFPAFYRDDLSIKDANRSMIAQQDHKIRLIIYKMHGDHEELFYRFANDDAIAYYLDGVEGNAYIKIFNNSINPMPRKNVNIPDEMLKLGLKFQIGKGIESLILKGDEEISDDFSEATDLKSIDTTHSNKYEKYDAANKKLVYKKEYIDKLQKELTSKIKDEYEKIYDDHCKFINLIKTHLDSLQDSAAEARKEAVDFVKRINDNSIELNGDNFNKANYLIDKAIEKMKWFKQGVLWTLWNNKIQNGRVPEYNKVFDEHCEFINSIGIELNSPQDGTTKARKEAFDFIDDICNNKIELTYENFQKANYLIDKAIEKMKQFKQLWTLWNNKIQNGRVPEYNKVFDEHCEFINSIGIELNSPQDGTTKARKEAFDFIDDICNNKIELTYENFQKANDLIDKAIESMRRFKRGGTLWTLWNNKIQNGRVLEYNKIQTEHCEFIKSIGIELNSPQDGTVKARQEALDFNNDICNNKIELTYENFQKANYLIDKAIEKMKQFKQLWTLWNDKIRDGKILEYNKIQTEHCEFIKSIGIELNSPQDGTVKARQEALDFVNDICNNKIELTYENFNKTNDLIDKAIESMKQFKQLWTLWNNKIQNGRVLEYNKIQTEHCEFIKSIGIELNSPQDGTVKARQEALDFVNDICNNKIELTYENFQKANDLIDKAIESMRRFKRGGTLWTLWNNKIQKDKAAEYNKIHDEHRKFIKSIGIEFNSPQDGTTEARKEAFDFIDDICNNKIELTYENFNKTNDLIDKAIESMKQFKCNYFNKLESDLENKRK